MADIEKHKTAAEEGLMAGFPPEEEKVVTHENQLYAPFNRWAFQNELALNRTVDVWRGNEQVAALEYDLHDLESVTYENRLGQRFSFVDMVEASATDGIVVLHAGKIIYERYLNGMQAHSLHAWASCSKSMTGALAVRLAHEGIIDMDAPVTATLPELKESGFAGASVRQISDMTAGVRFREDEIDPVNENDAYSRATGWRTQPEGYCGPRTVYEFLPTMLPDGKHGERFTYLTPQSDVLAWVIKRVTNLTLAEATSRFIWSRLGCERDAFWIVGPAAVETAGSGLLTTLRDAARFAQMLLDNGKFNNEQILPESAVRDIAAGGDPAVFAAGPAAGPGNRGWSYHHQWWHTHNPHGAYLGLGYGGQMIYIDPAARMAIVKFSSYPTPTPAGNEFYAAFGAFPALAQALQDGL